MEYLGNESISMKMDIDQPLKIKIDEENLKIISSNKIDSLIIRVDKIENQISKKQK